MINPTNSKIIKTERIVYKAFSDDLSCRGYQYKVGQTYTHQGEIIPCQSGFHCCPNALDCLSYYPGKDSRFCRVQYGETHIVDGEKIVTNEITIMEEITGYALEKLLTGKQKGYYESGAPGYEKVWKNGKQDGLEKGWYESGAPKYEKGWKNGKRDGLAKGWYESGVLKYEQVWKNGKGEGVEKAWYESGAPRYEKIWKNGKQEGVEKGWFESGAPAYKCGWENGKREGVEKGWFESGELWYEQVWKNGKREGSKGLV